MTGSAIVRSIALGCLVVAGVSAGAGCNKTLAPQSSFYDERIGPVLENSCARQTTGCHIDDGTGRATGNLDLSSYDALAQRKDVLPPYGPYSLGLLLIKGGTQVDVSVSTFDTDPTSGEPFAHVTTDVRHNAGQTIARDSPGFAEIRNWINAGFTRYGVPPDTYVQSQGVCQSGAGSDPNFDPTAAPADQQGFDAFVQNVQPVLESSCAGGFCHGNPAADFYLTCGDTDAEKRWNFFVAVQHLDNPASTSSLLRRPLSQYHGGTFHEGGNVFGSTSDSRYQTILSWAEDLVGRRPDLVQHSTPDPGLKFFADRVQPILVKKGCMFLDCHSPSMFHDLRLRGGAAGNFSEIATRKNYEMSRLMLAIQSADPNQSRIIAKNLFRPSPETPGAQGIEHRGGSLLEDFSSGGVLSPATPSDCAGIDADTGDLNQIPAYCVLARWHDIERQDAISRGEIMATEVQSLVWVARPPDVGDFLDFDTFRGGADLRTAPVTVNADRSITLGTSTSLLGGCGLGASPDVRRPAVSWDGKTIAFAARPSAAQPLRLYEMNTDGSNCQRIPGIAPAVDMENGILTHDFDPAFAPDGRIVFASTRGNLDRSSYSYQGPTRTPAAMQPNANLYIFDPSSGQVRQLTFLLDQELAPSFMADGRLIFTAEKREPNFHQLALRRENLDGGDYHPLFAQRQSVGFNSATEVVELPNRNLAFVAGPLDAHDGAGTIVVANRSIGPDQYDRDPTDKSYIHSMSIPYLGALAQQSTVPAVPMRNAATAGAFRSPAALPTGRLVVSCDLSASSLEAGPYAYQLCEMDPSTGAVRVIGGEAGMANIESVAVYARPDNGVFQSRTDEVNGHTKVVPGEKDAIVHVLDMPLLGTLLFANTREGRPIDSRVGGFDVLEAMPPPTSATTFADVANNVVQDQYGQVYVDYRDLGFVPDRGDGSAKFEFPGGHPILLRLTDAADQPLQFPAGSAFQGDMTQREEMQFYPGEHANQSMPRRFFDGLCGGCHGSITNRELDVRVNVDVLTSASRTLSRDAEPVRLGF